MCKKVNDAVLHNSVGTMHISLTRPLRPCLHCTLLSFPVDKINFIYIRIHHRYMASATPDLRLPFGNSIAPGTYFLSRWGRRLS